MKNIHQLEENLYEKWIESYSKEEREKFCFDGLCYNGIVCNNGFNAETGNEEQLWEQAERKIVFLMKDTNKNERQDYRPWPWRDITRPFFRAIMRWLEGISTITKDYIPLCSNDDYSDDSEKIVTNYPLAIVNIKKLSGYSSVNNATLRAYAEKDAVFLKEQILDILKPNIVVCGGGSGTIKDIAKTYLYPDMEKFSNWCYYSQSSNVLIVNSYHPSAYVSNEDKFDDMMRAIQRFMIDNNFTIH